MLDTIAQTRGDQGDVVLVGHRYAGLVVGEAADRRADLVDRLVLIDACVGPSGSSLFALAPEGFESSIRALVARGSDERMIPIPAPPPAVFGFTDASRSEWLQERVRPQPLLTFTEATQLTGAVDQIPGLAAWCRPPIYPFAELAGALGYPLRAIDRSHDVILTDPKAIVEMLLHDGWCTNAAAVT